MESIYIQATKRQQSTLELAWVKKKEDWELGAFLKK